MAELRPRPDHDAAPAKQLQPRIESNLPERHDNLYVRQCADLRFEVIETAGDLLGERLVVRRRASDRRGDVRIREPQAVNTRPVRLAPCAAGARPSSRRRADGSPKPGTGRPQYVSPS
jgi:hypothetical protein